MRTHHVIESLHVDGGAFFRDVTFTFAEALNCVFGGTGVGKSGLLLSIRYALGAPPPADAKVYDAFIEGVLGGGELVVTVRTKTGVRYTCKRRYGEPPRVYDERGNVAHVSLDGELFKIEAYGQGALQGIARSPEARLELVDGFAREETRRLALEIAALDQQLAQNGDDVRRLTDEIEAAEGSVVDLASIAEAIESLKVDAGGDAEAFARADVRKRARGGERIATKAIEAAVAGARAGLEAYATETLQRLGTATAGGEAADAIRDARAAANGVAAAVEAGRGEIRAALGRAEATLAEVTRALLEAHTTEDDAYQALVRRHEDDRLRSAERERLHRRFEELTAATKRLDDLRAAKAAKRDESVRIFDARERLLDARSTLREKIAADITEALKGTISVRIERGANDVAYRAFLAEAFKGANIRPPEIADDIVAHIRPRDLFACVERDDPAPIERADRSRGGNRAARAHKVLMTLRASDRLAELETVVVGDTPHVELMVGGEYRPSDKISPGQMGICLLPIILLQTDVPLLIDQAEDNLDNGYIYVVLVKTLLLVKRHRQLIFVTHNANVPVLGDAEKSFLLAVVDGGGTIAQSGDVDAMREWMEAMLDGGAEAFRRRAERYGYQIEPK